MDLAARPGKGLGQDRADRAVVVGDKAGFIANTVAIGLRWREAYAMGFQQAPLSNLYESVVFFAWSILLVYLLFDLKYILPAQESDLRL